MLALLKALWRKFAEKGFALNAMFLIAILLTVNAVTSIDNPPVIDALIILLDIIFFIIFIFWED